MCTKQSTADLSRANEPRNSTMLIQSYWILSNAIYCSLVNQEAKRKEYFSNKDKNILDTLTNYFRITISTWIHSLEMAEHVERWTWWPFNKNIGVLLAVALKKRKIRDEMEEKRDFLLVFQAHPINLAALLQSQWDFILLTRLFQILCRWACQLNLNSGLIEKGIRCFAALILSYFPFLVKSRVWQSLPFTYLCLCSASTRLGFVSSHRTKSLLELQQDFVKKATNEALGRSSVH